MRLASFVLLGILWVGSVAAPARALEPVNAVVGDESFEDEVGRPPNASDSEVERIRAHLFWVIAQLRTHPLSALNEAQRAHRNALLAALVHYAEVGQFPQRSDAVAGRRPRFVDDEGRHCAVAFLIATSGRPELVQAVQRAHEYDYVLDMHEASLLAWATEHGFTALELAMIQPTYEGGGGVDMPDPREEARLEEERRRAARVPRSLEAPHVREALARVTAHSVSQACATELAGHWQLNADVAVRERLRVVVTARVSPIEGSTAMPRLEVCAREVIEGAMRELLASAAYRFRAPIAEHIAFRIDVASHEETALQLAARLVAGRAAIQACFAEAQPSLGSAPMRLPVRVIGWNGEVQIRWDVMRVTAMTTTLPAERTRFYCVQDVLTYGRFVEHAARDLDFEVELSADGQSTVRP